VRSVTAAADFLVFELCLSQTQQTMRTFRRLQCGLTCVLLGAAWQTWLGKECRGFCPPSSQGGATPLPAMQHVLGKMWWLSAMHTRQPAASWRWVARVAMSLPFNTAVALCAQPLAAGEPCSVV
jgi:hypothetical protein